VNEEMITWPNLIGSTKFLLIFIFVAVDDCCHCPSSGPPPTIDSISPNIGTQGTDVVVTITGSFSRPDVLIDGKIQGVVGEVSTDYVASEGAVSPITLTFHIGANARVGRHFVAVYTAQSGLTTEPDDFTVTCPGCPPPPELVNVADPSGAPLVSGGPAVTAKIVGTNFSHPNPQVQIDPPGISFPPGPYNVQNDGTYDYFLVPLTADPNAPTGFHFIRVTTDGGTSNAFELNLISSQPPSSPTPGGTPFLRSITPMHIAKNSQALVYIKCEGNGFSGFGIFRNIVIDQFGEIPVPYVAFQQDQDEVAVVPISTYGLFQSDTALTVRVHNLTNDTFSDRLLLFLDEPRLGQPWVTGVSAAVNRGGDVAVVIFGQNLDGVTDQSFSGIAGLTFSNTQPCGLNNPACPSFPPGEGLSVNVHADLNGPVTGEDATNLTITTAHGPSNPFAFSVGPPIP
jgi:hypothetical protein